VVQGSQTHAPRTHLPASEQPRSSLHLERGCAATADWLQQLAPANSINSVDIRRVHGVAAYSACTLGFTFRQELSILVPYVLYMHLNVLYKKHCAAAETRPLHPQSID
jgi:hypothetical protein